MTGCCGPAASLQRPNTAEIHGAEGTDQPRLRAPTSGRARRLPAAPPSFPPASALSFARTARSARLLAASSRPARTAPPAPSYQAAGRRSAARVRRPASSGRMLATLATLSRPVASGPWG